MRPFAKKCIVISHVNLMIEHNVSVLYIVIHLSWFPIQTYDHVFTDTLLEFDRVFDTSENRSVLENTDLLSLIEKSLYFLIRTYFCLRGRPVIETERKPPLMYYNVNTVTLARTYR